MNNETIQIPLSVLRSQNIAQAKQTQKRLIIILATNFITMMLVPLSAAFVTLFITAFFAVMFYAELERTKQNEKKLMVKQ